MRPPISTPIDLSFRLGAGTLGLFAGGVLGLAVAVGLILWGREVADLGTPILGGALAGAVSGLLLPRDTMDAVEVLLHILFGAVLERPDQIDRHAPRHLRLAFLFGSLLAVLVWWLV